MEPDRWLGLDLRHLVALTAIAEEGSFGRAAERLGYTQSAVSQQIAALERIVGCGSSSVRRARGRSRSPRRGGSSFGTQKRSRLGYSPRRPTWLALEAGDAGQLRVGTFQSVGAQIMPTLLRRFSEAHPAVEVVLRESPGRERAPDDDRAGRARPDLLDVARRSEPVRVASSCCSDPYVLVVPAGSPLAALKRITDAEGDRSPPADRVQPLQRDGRRWSRSSGRGRPPAERRLSLGQQRHRPGPCRRGRRGELSPRC